MTRNNHCNNEKNNNGNKLDIHEISLLGVEARGQVAWVQRQYLEDRCVLSEIELAYRMSRYSEFLFKEGGMKGKPDYQSIAVELNLLYHNGADVRNRYSVRNALYKYRKNI